MVGLLIAVLIILLVCGAIVFIIRSAPFIDEPFKSWAIWVVCVICVLIVLLKLIPMIQVGGL